MLLADYGIVEAGKINALGAGVTAIGINPGLPGFTIGFALIVQVGVPHQFYNAECSVEMLLEHAGGGLVEISPSPGLPPQPVRVGQAVRFDPPVFQRQVSAPSNYLPARVQWVLNFTTGLPLVPGQGYAWRVKIDDSTRDEWLEKFVVIGAPARPVLG
jgi:hypothetical protein